MMCRRQIMSPRRAIPLIALLSVTACEPNLVEPTVVQIALHSDLKPSRVEVALVDAEGNLQAREQTPDFDPSSSNWFLLSFVVHRANRYLHEQRVRLRAFHPNVEPPVLQQTFTVPFQDETALRADVLLPKACLGIVCNLGESCRDQSLSCVPDSVKLSTTVNTELRRESSSSPEPPPPSGFIPCGALDGTCPARNCSGVDDKDCLLHNGGECTASEFCASQFCVRGRCCESLCDTDLCHFCDESGSCRTPLYESDPENCGACGFRCGTQNVATRPECIDGNCRLVCLAGNDDCDRDPRNGCEVDLASATEHCGECSSRCRYACRERECVGTKFPEEEGNDVQLDAVQAPGKLILTELSVPLPSDAKVLAVGLHVKRIGAGTVKMFLFSSADSKPGALLGWGETDLTESKGAYGTEVQFKSPVQVPQGLTTWIGFVLSEMAHVKHRRYSGHKRFESVQTVNEAYDGSTLPLLIHVTGEVEPNVYLVYAADKE